MYKVSEIAEFLNAKVYGDSNLTISNLRSLHEATIGDISFCAQPKYLKQLVNSSATAVLVKNEEKHKVKNSAIVVDDPYLAFAKISSFFDWRKKVIANVASSAIIGHGSKITNGAQICHGVVIGENTKISKGCYIGPNCVIGDDCVVGKNTRLEANVTLYTDVEIGSNCIVHASAVIGADGFGFAKNKKNWQKIHQIGGVRIGDDVEIGASTTIDRGAVAHTVVGNGVKLDNQIQIAHNVILGDNTAIAGGTAIAGSTEIGENCTISGMCGVTGHLTIVAGTHITAKSLVSHSIKEAGVYSSGTGIDNYQSWKRNVVRFRNLDKLAKQVKVLEIEFKKLK